MSNYRLYKDTLHHAFLSVRSDSKRYLMLNIKSILDNIINDPSIDLLMKSDCRLSNKINNILMTLKYEHGYK